MAKHGVYVSEAATSLSSPTQASSGIPFVIGTAPLGGTATAGTPVLCRTYDEAEAAIGYDDDWEKNTLCEFMYSHFKLFAMQPVIFLPLAAESEASAVAAAVEKVDLCMGKYGIVPDLILAPGFSETTTVAAAMAAKAAAINGMFKAKAIVDITAASATAAVGAKTSGSFGTDSIVCWPKAKAGDKTFHLSTLVAGRIAATDTDNEGIPYESPSNKALPIDSLVDSEGVEIILPKGDADTLNAAGIVTALNFMARFVLWGNYTGAHPSEKDPKDILIPVSRMFGWVHNTIQQTFWENIDMPMNRRLLDSVLDTCNQWFNRLVNSGYLLGARAAMLDSENPDENLMAGIVKIHLYFTPPSPAQEIDFVLEYDADYVSSALSS